MRSISIKHKVMQVSFVVLLMSLLAWLATGWQETQPLQLSYEPNVDMHINPWPEDHLIIPVSAEQEQWDSDDSSHQFNTHSM